MSSSSFVFSTFGHAVDVDGDFMIVGDNAATVNGNPNSGAVYILDRSKGDVTKYTTFTTGAFESFGAAVAISGDIAVAGAPNANSAYVFERQGSAWVQSQLLPSGIPFGFGVSVAVDGETVVIGDVSLLASGVDTAYVFERVSGNWVETAVYTSGNPASSFGAAVAISGDTLLVGAPGQSLQQGVVNVYERQGGVWPATSSTQLVANDAANFDLFGGALDLLENTAVISAIGDDDLGLGSGSIYVFDNAAGVWNQTTKLNASDGAANAEFGTDVAIDGDRLVVGSRFSAQLGNNSGSAYVFDRSSGSWAQSDRLLASDGMVNDWYGVGVGVDGDRVLVGSYQNNGVVYEYSYPTSSGDLLSDTACVSSAAGGMQTFTVRAGSSYAGMVYWLFGSASGTTPGFAFGGVQVPLNFDDYFNATLLNPNLPPFTNNLGSLDANGEAVVPLTVTGGLAPAGQRLNHAYVVMDFYGNVLYVSQPVDLYLTQ